MLIVLPLLALVCLFLLVSFWDKTQKLLFRERIIICFILWSLLFLLLTEALSLFNLINLISLGVSWLVIILFPLPLLFIEKHKLKNKLWPRLKIDFEGDDLLKIQIIGISFILLTTLALALFVAPNNFDAMTYHLARIPHWIQNQNISYYPTHITWQIYLAPWASYPKLHFQLLSGGDWFSNFTQWIYVFPTLLGISLLAKSFGANPKNQIFASFIAATVPMGIFQASTSQDDYILTFFLVSFAYFGLTFLKKTEYLFLLASGASLGLALLTKQTAYIYSFPFLVWFIWLWMSKFGLKKMLIYLSLLGLIVVSVNLGFFARNYNLTGLPIFSFRDDYINKPVGIESLASGVIKNVALHLSTPIPALDSWVFNAVVNLHNLMGIPINKPGLNWHDMEFSLFDIQVSEYSSPNTLHLILAALSILGLIKVKDKISLKYYLLCLVIGFVAFSALLRWQPSSSRLHLPIFILWSPIIVSSIKTWNTWLKTLIVVILFTTSSYFLFLNELKPIIGSYPFFLVDRQRQYFVTWPGLHEPYKAISGLVGEGKYKNAGLILEEMRSDFEYPLWVMLRQRNPNLVIEHVDVENQTRRFSKGFKPDVVIFLGGNRDVLRKYIEAKIPIIGL